MLFFFLKFSSLHSIAYFRNMDLFPKDLLDGLLLKDDFTLSKYSSFTDDLQSNKSVVRPLRSDDYLKGY